MAARPATERKRPAEAAIGAATAAPAFKKARFLDLAAPDESEKNIGPSEETTPVSPPSIASTDQIPLTATSATSRSTSKRAKKYICEHDGCDRAFDRPIRLEAHLRTHTGEKPFACEEEDCDKRFFKAEHLRAHVLNKHSNEANHLCTYVLSTNEDGEEFECGKAFTTASRLKRHFAAHEKKEELKCQELGCGKVFRKMETLQRHIKKEHLGEDSFRCTKIVHDEVTGADESCGEAFSTVSQLKAHETREHAGNRYFCEICSPPDDESAVLVGFPTYNEYQAHLKIVHPPTCTTCGKICDSQRALVAHMEIEHSSLASRQKVICPHPNCGRGFTRKGNLNVHIQSVHVKHKKFVCGQFDLTDNDKCPGWSGQGCGLHFTTKASLEGHVRTQHLNLEPLRPRRRQVRIKEENDNDTTVSSMMDLDEAVVGDHNALGLLTGHGYASTRPIACWVSECAVRFSRDYDLAQHMELTHGWHVDDINDHLAEKQALEGERFWTGGVGDDLDAQDEALRMSLSQALTLQNTELQGVSDGYDNGLAEVLGGSMFDSAGEFNDGMDDGQILSNVPEDGVMPPHSFQDESFTLVDPALAGL